VDSATFSPLKKVKVEQEVFGRKGTRIKIKNKKLRMKNQRIWIF
jgi:hypothetical protein